MVSAAEAAIIATMLVTGGTLGIVGAIQDSALCMAGIAIILCALPIKLALDLQHAAPRALQRLAVVVVT